MKTFSIVIATFNSEKYISRCIDSIVKQNKQLYELIIIDGKSTDRTLNIVKQYDKYVDICISESDRGIYDAWNKALKFVTTDWIMFMGSDDIMVENALDEYKLFIEKNNIESTQIDLITSKIILFNEKNSNIKEFGNEFKWNEFIKKMTIAHPGALHSRNFIDKNGSFNIKYRIVGDYEYFLRYGCGLKTKHFDKVMIYMQEGGVSNSFKAVLEHTVAQLRNKNVNNRYAYCYFLRTFLILTFKKIFFK